MERIPAFRPKISEAEGSSSPESLEKTEGPLQSLEKDKSQIAGFNFALKAVLEGRITAKQLEQLANPPRFRNSGGTEFLADEANQFVEIAGQYQTRQFIESRRLSKVDVPVLT